MIGSTSDQSFFGTVLNLIFVSASPGLIRTNPHFIRTRNKMVCVKKLLAAVLPEISMVLLLFVQNKSSLEGKKYNKLLV